MGKLLKKIWPDVVGGALWDMLRMVGAAVGVGVLTGAWGWIASLPGPLLFHLFLGTFAITLLLLNEIQRWRLIAQSRKHALELSQQSAHQKASVSASGDWDQVNAAALRKSLAAHFCEHANARIRFMTLQQKLLAERIASVFQLAGWEAEVVSVPMEPVMRRFIRGTEVVGPNRALVEGVAAALTKAGLRNIVTSITDLSPDPPDNLKWKRIERRVEINVGDQS